MVDIQYKCVMNKASYLSDDETRVQLHPLLGVTGSNYINASHIYVSVCNIFETFLLKSLCQLV